MKQRGITVSTLEPAAREHLSFCQFTGSDDLPQCIHSYICLKPVGVYVYIYAVPRAYILANHLAFICVRSFGQFMMTLPLPK